MIYGWNFNNTPIPDQVKWLFARYKKFDGKGKLLLKGMCNSIEEAKLMEMQATNDKRVIAIAGPRKNDGKEWYGIYCSY